MSRAVASIKERGVALFAPELGGSYDVFLERLLRPEIVDYCCADVAYFGVLEARLFTCLPPVRQDWVRQQSDARVAWCLKPTFEKGQHNAVAPV